MAARAQMKQVKMEEFNLKRMKSTKDWSKNYVLIQSFVKQLTLLVKQCFFHACNKSDHLQLRPEAAIMQISISSKTIPTGTNPRGTT